MGHVQILKLVHASLGYFLHARRDLLLQLPHLQWHRQEWRGAETSRLPSRLERLLARLAELSDRASRLPAALDALVPEGGAGDARHLCEAQRALRPAERVSATQEDGRHHGGCDRHAPI